MTQIEGQGSVAALIAVVAAALAAPPVDAERAMALVVSPVGGGDHLGLLIHGQPSPGGLDLLTSRPCDSRTTPHENGTLVLTAGIKVEASVVP
ncbi:MAG: hypothetical protein HGA45_41450 [Chloroflexales bacterium]|nr:hypothetical protein [Chloroflexales bacterium]